MAYDLNNKSILSHKNGIENISYMPDVITLHETINIPISFLIYSIILF